MNGAVIVTCARSARQKSRCDAEFLDAAEDVVPAPDVEPGAVLAQLVEDLVHLERGEHRLDQHRGLDRALRDAELALRGDEDVVPQPRFEVALHLGQVEIGAGVAGEQRLRVVEEVEREIEDRRRTPAAPSIAHVLFQQVPAARPHQQRRGLCRSARSACPPGLAKSMVRLTASRRLIWPSIMFSQVGEFESSKSAMNTLAPQLSALITILRSVGPVISTRRSCRSLRRRPPRSIRSRGSIAVSGRKSGSLPASNSAWRRARAAISSRRRPSNLRASLATKASACGVENIREGGRDLAADVDACWERFRAAHDGLSSSLVLAFPARRYLVPRCEMACSGPYCNALYILESRFQLNVLIQVSCGCKGTNLEPFWTVISP